MRGEVAGRTVWPSMHMARPNHNLRVMKQTFSSSVPLCLRG